MSFGTPATLAPIVLSQARARAISHRRQKHPWSSSKLGEALAYLDQHWVGLVRYCDDGRYGLDTNPVENAIRRSCVGRRRWLFSDNVAGAKSSANLYSLIEPPRPTPWSSTPASVMCSPS